MIGGAEAISARICLDSFTSKCNNFFSDHHHSPASPFAASPSSSFHRLPSRGISQTSCASKMGVWDVFTGKKSTQSASNPPPSEGLLNDPAGNTSTQIQQPTFSTEDVGSFITPGQFDPAALHPLAGLNQDTLDYLTLDDDVLSDLPGSQSVLPSRGWSDDLCYGTGVTYLTGLTIGGAWGLAEGLNRLPSTAPPKLRLNSALNSITRRGPFLGNSAGVVALMYNGINSTIGYYRGKHDALNSIAAGGISGAVFKATRGARPMMISSGIVASMAGTWAVSFRVSSKLSIKVVS